MSTPVLTCKIGHKWTDQMKYSKGKKGSRILTHNGTKKTATNLFVLFSEEWNKKETTIPLQEQKKKIIISEWFLFVYDTRDDLTRYEDMKITLRTMITMRIIAVKLPMMIPMTRDMVGDIPDKFATLEKSTDITIGECFFCVFFSSPWSVLFCFIIVIENEKRGKFTSLRFHLLSLLFLLLVLVLKGVLLLHVVLLVITLHHLMLGLEWYECQQSQIHLCILKGK